MAIKRKFPATGSKGENSVTGILKKNFLKRSQILQDNKKIKHHSTNNCIWTIQTYF